MGLSLRKIATAMITRSIKSRIDNTISKLNYGTISNGIPIFSAMMNILVSKQYPLNFISTVIEFDIHNAFNDVYRLYMRRVCKYYYPDIYWSFLTPFIRKHSKIYYNHDLMIDSTRGFQQGDGLAVMFPLVIYHLFHNDPEFMNIHFIKFFLWWWTGFDWLERR